MIEVVALVCSMQAPLRCKDLHLSFAAESVTPQQCMLYGQTELAKWTNEHPGWRISHGFKCGPAGRYAKI
jgi:hypothetical protein